MTTKSAKRHGGTHRAIRLFWTDAHQPSSEVFANDPLGLEHLESRIANWMWPGFTNRATHAGYYVMVPYGLYIAELVAKRYGLSATDETIRTLFNRFERFWAMAVCAHHDGNVPPEDAMRGLRGATAAFAGRKAGRYPLDYQLIARQRELGALGAYLTSLRDHRMVAQDRLRVTPLGWEVAQWLWDDPSPANAAYDELVIHVLDPRSTSIPSHLSRTTLAALGRKLCLSNIRRRPTLQVLLAKRLFEDAPPPEELAVLPEMVRVCIEAKRQGVTDPRVLLEAIQRNAWGLRCSSELTINASVAAAFADLGHVLRSLFDRMYHTVLSGGYESTWSECVREAITKEIVTKLDAEVAVWTRLRQEARLAALSGCGRLFVEVVRRMNSQNPYNIFESVLNLHVQSQRLLGRGGGWIERRGEAVFMRYSGGERWAAQGTSWTPQFRMGAMVALLDDLGRLA